MIFWVYPQAVAFHRRFEEDLSCETAGVVVLGPQEEGWLPEICIPASVFVAGT